MLDLVIKGGNVVDGSGAGPVRADIGVEDGRIVALDGAVGRARKVIDASGKLVVPGFIDIHTHSDFTLPVRPDAPAKLLQGVTTDVTGNCGFSPFPLNGNEEARRHGAFIEPRLDVRWPDLTSYAADLESHGLGINVAPLVGLGAIRLDVMGEEERPATADELEHMCELVRRTLRQGACGGSSGLVYAPSSFADVSELAALATVIAEAGCFYATHMRNEADGLESALEEAFEVARLSGCSLQISHLKQIGRHNWGHIDAVLERIEDEIAGGLDIWVDAYPYTAGSSTLATLVPASELNGGEQAFLKRLEDPSERERVATLLAAGEPFALEDVILATVPTRPELSGRYLVDAAAESGQAPSEFALDLLRTGIDVSMVAFGMSEADVARVLAHPRTIVASDGWTMAIDATGYAHPRNFAYTIRLLARYARDECTLALGDAVRKLSSIPAERLGFLDRGSIRPGAIADLAVLDFERLSEESTFESPCAYPRGVEWVFLAGDAAVAEGALTDARAGRVLLRNGGSI